MAAKTTAGRIMTIFYSMIGVPLLIIALEGFGSWLFQGMQWLWHFYLRFLAKYFQKVTSRRKHDFMKSNGQVLSPFDVENLETNEKQKLLPLSMAICFLFIWVLVGAGIFCLFQKWDYFTSVYFFYISLLTIGEEKKIKFEHYFYFTGA